MSKSFEVAFDVDLPHVTLDIEMLQDWFDWLDNDDGADRVKADLRVLLELAQEARS